MNYPQQVTMIDDLPELDQIADGYYNPHDQPGPDVTGLIRKAHMPPAESGMVQAKQPGYNNYGAAYSQNNPAGQARRGYQQAQMHPPGLRDHRVPMHPPNVRGHHQMHPMLPPEEYNLYPFAEENERGDNSPVRENFSSMGNCLDVSEHIENCPICSKLYKQDKTVMIIIIVILAIICILLLKKVLNL